MRYLRWIIAVLFLVSGGVALGQKETKASIMKKAFNDIRVEMVLDACKIMGYENTELMDKYRSEKNLDVFHKAMGKEKEDDKGNKQLEYLWLIIGEANTNVTLDGESLAGYQESITNFRTQLKEAYDGKNGNRLSCFKSFLNNKLVEEKKDEVNSNNEKYKRKIDVLIADCRLYEAAERSREWQAYIETNGVFVELAKSQKKEKDVFDKISILTQAKDTAQCDVFIKNNPMSVYLSEVKLKRNELKNLVKYEQFVIDAKYKSHVFNWNDYSDELRDTFRHDFHQILAYCSFNSMQTKSAMLVYPFNNFVSHKIKISSPLALNDAFVYFVGIPLEKNKIEDVKEGLNQIIKFTIG